MKPAFLIPLAACAACIGYGLGTLGGAPIGLPAATQMAAPAQFDAPHALKLSEEAGRTLSALSSPKRLEDFVAIHALFAGVLPSEFPKLMDIAGRFPAKVRTEKMLLIFRAWIRADRQAAGAWARPFAERCVPDGFSHDSDSLVTELTKVWAAKYREEALALAHSQWPKEGATHILKQVINTCAAGEFAQLFTQLISLPAGTERTDVLDWFLLSWSKSDPSRALSVAKSLPAGAERQTALRQLVLAGAEVDPMSAFAQAVELGISDSSFLASLGGNAGWKKGAEFSKWLTESPPELLETVAPEFVKTWAHRDAKAALSWAAENGISIIEGSTLMTVKMANGIEWSTMGSSRTASALFTAMQNQPTETAKWLLSQPAGEERDELVRFALSSNPASAAHTLFDALPPEKQPAAVADVVVAGQTQPAKVREWAATLLVGPIQDAAWKAIGVRGELPPDSLQGRARDKLLEGHAASYLADSAALSPMLAKIATITDPAIRRRAFEITMWGALHGGRPAVSATAKEALEKANVPADWKAALRDSLSR